MTVKELSEASGISKTTIYKLVKRLGRMPTIDEVMKERPNGRPVKYISKEE